MYEFSFQMSIYHPVSNDPKSLLELSIDCSSVCDSANALAIIDYAPCNAHVPLAVQISSPRPYNCLSFLTAIVMRLVVVNILR